MPVQKVSIHFFGIVKLLTMLIMYVSGPVSSTKWKNQSNNPTIHIQIIYSGIQTVQYE